MLLKMTIPYRTVPDLVVHVSGSLQDVREGEAGGADASDNCPPHNVVRVVGKMVKVGLNMSIV
jgi:hypothetical protein